MPEQNQRTAILLGAGLGSRLRSQVHAKPFARVGETTLLQRLLIQLKQNGYQRILVALRDELLSALDRARLPQGVEYLFLNTPSSLHTLERAVAEAQVRGKNLFVSMVDTVLSDRDFAAFTSFCERLPPGENAILGTRFIDDENPLYVHVDAFDRVHSLGAPASPIITSGMYFLTPEAQKAVPPAVASGMEKMRNFLALLVNSPQPMRLFVVEKSLDIDRPEDLLEAKKFL